MASVSGLFFINKIAKLLGIEDRLVSWGPIDIPGTQIDLLLIRNDNTINVCELKLRADHAHKSLPGKVECGPIYFSILLIP